MTSPTKTKLNILQRISAIQSQVTAVAKDANVDNKYQAVQHDDVTRMLRPLMVDHGVISTIDASSSTMVDTGAFWGKRKLFQMQSKFLVTYYNVDDKEDTLSVIVEAHADDAGDKAPGKTMSYAQKYADLKTFRIPTGENDEERIDSSQITEETLNAENTLALFEYAELSFPDPMEVLTSMATKIFQVEGYTHILNKHFPVAMRKLQNKASDEIRTGENNGT